jgi:tetratricopeptide (TPR) repeat protein
MAKKKGVKRTAGPSRTGMPAAPERSWSGLHPFLIALLAVLIYSNTLSVPFVFDDKPYVVENPAVKDLRYFADRDLAQRAIASYRLDVNFQTRIVGFFSFALNYAVHGLHAAGFHAVNILIHILNGLLVYWLVVLLFRTPFVRSAGVDGRASRRAALFAALLFVSHPVQTQAVPYVSQRFTSLAAFFCMLSLVLYVRARLSDERRVGTVDPTDLRSPSRSRFYLFYGASLAVALLAMWTKEISFTLPLVIMLFEFSFFDGERGKRLLVLVPLLLTMLVIPVTILVSKEAYSDMTRLTGSFAPGDPGNAALSYLYTQFRVIVTYLRLLVLPFGQNLDYDYPMFRSFLHPVVLLSVILILVVLGAALAAYRRSRSVHGAERAYYRIAAFGILWFFIFLAVESTVIPLKDVIFEHRLYLPSVGFFLCVVALAGIVQPRLGPAGAKRIAWIFAAVIVAWSVAGYARNLVWGNAVGLWQDSVKKSPQKARPHQNLGFVYAELQQFDDAIREYGEALRIDPKYRDAYRNLGYAYIQKDDLVSARAILEQGVEVDGHDAWMRTDLGVAYEKLGLLHEAEQEYRQAISIRDLASARSNLTVILLKQNRIDEALQSIEQAVRLEPDNPHYWFNLGNAHALKGDYAGAAECYEEVLARDPAYDKAREFLADSRKRARTSRKDRSGH